MADHKKMIYRWTTTDNLCIELDESAANKLKAYCGAIEAAICRSQSIGDQAGLQFDTQNAVGLLKFVLEMDEEAMHSDMQQTSKMKLCLETAKFSHCAGLTAFVSNYLRNKAFAGQLSHKQFVQCLNYCRNYQLRNCFNDLIAYLRILRSEEMRNFQDFARNSLPILSFYVLTCCLKSGQRRPGRFQHKYNAGLCSNQCCKDQRPLATFAAVICMKCADAVCRFCGDGSNVGAKKSTDPGVLTCKFCTFCNKNFPDCTCDMFCVDDLTWDSFLLGE